MDDEGIEKAVHWVDQCTPDAGTVCGKPTQKVHNYTVLDTSSVTCPDCLSIELKKCQTLNTDLKIEINRLKTENAKLSKGAETNG